MCMKTVSFSTKITIIIARLLHIRTQTDLTNGSCTFHLLFSWGPMFTESKLARVANTTHTLLCQSINQPMHKYCTQLQRLKFT